MIPVVLSVFRPSAACFVMVVAVALPPAAHSQAFAVTSIKPVRSVDPGNARTQVLPNGDFVAKAVPVIRLLSYAYDVPANPSPRLSGLPDWTIREKYDIEAKAPSDAIARGLPAQRSAKPKSANDPRIAR